MSGARSHSSRWLLLFSIIACAGPIDAEPPQPPAASASTPAVNAAPPLPPATSVADHEKAVRNAIAAYRFWRPADSELHWAPGDCALPNLGNYHESGAPEETSLHGGKLYLVYAMDVARFATEAWGRETDDLQIGVHDDPVVAQAIVKETFRPEPDQPRGPPMPMKDPVTGEHGNPPGPILRDGKLVYAGEPRGLFVMVQLRAGGPETDNGWIYATTDKNGTLTAFGRIADCEKCHRLEPDRVFGWGDPPGW